MPRCVTCDVGWTGTTETCWSCGGAGRDDALFPQFTRQEVIPAALIADNRRWVMTADLGTLPRPVYQPQ